MRYIRCERKSTCSWITYKLPKTFNCSDELEEYLKVNLPGWEWVSASLNNPDQNDGN